MEEKSRKTSDKLVRVVVFGPESTGKTTLARELATHYQTVWVPEYARTYLQEKWDNTQSICQPEDIMPIVKGQLQWEIDYRKKANKILFCDTDVLQTKVYSEAYYEGWSPPELENIVYQEVPDLYLLTNIDIPWENDVLRDRPYQRGHMFNLFETELKKYQRNFVNISGDKSHRLNLSISQINSMLS